MMLYRCFWFNICLIIQNVVNEMMDVVVGARRFGADVTRGPADKVLVIVPVYVI